MKPRRASFVVVFGEGAQRWSMPDPAHHMVDEAQWRVRYADAKPGDALILADTASALAYLIYTCPTTKLACRKLAEMRAAVRELKLPIE
jgi:hypothetical protein